MVEVAFGRSYGSPDGCVDAVAHPTAISGGTRGSALRVRRRLGPPSHRTDPPARSAFSQPLDRLRPNDQGVNVKFPPASVPANLYPPNLPPLRESAIESPLSGPDFPESTTMTLNLPGVPFGRGW